MCFITIFHGKMAVLLYNISFKFPASNYELKLKDFAEGSFGN